MCNINIYILCLFVLFDICYILELGNLFKEKFGKFVKYIVLNKKYYLNIN